jgi:hypothetical protein
MSHLGKNKTHNQERHVMADYIPNTDDGLLPWFANLKAKVAGYTGTFGLTPARVGAVTQACDTSTNAINLTKQKKNDWQAQVATKNSTLKANFATLRAEINQWKKNPAMTPAIAADLEITGTDPAFDPDTFKASITAEILPGHVRIKFKKGQTEGINLYSRLKGQAAWKFVSRDTNSPYDDYTPLAVAGQAEVREYQAIGVLHDAQIGQPSDIVSVTVAG